MNTRCLPDDLARVLRDQSVVVPQDQAVFELIGEHARRVMAAEAAARESGSRRRRDEPLDDSA